MTVTADALDLLAGDPPRYPHVPGDFHRHPETGAPYVNHPTETRKDGTPKRVMYGRPSSFGSALDNPYNLVKWKERQLLKGAWSIEPEQFYAVDWDDKNAVDGLAARCHEAAGSSLAADRGTHIHRILEEFDRHGSQGWQWLAAEGEELGIPAALQAQIVAQWYTFRFKLGLTALAVEQTVVNDRWRLAGTLDRLDVADHDILTAYGVLEAGVPFVGDIKTGSLVLGNDGQPSYWVKFSVQLAAYVDAVPYDTETDERGTVDMFEWVPPNPHIALIYHYDLARALDGEPVDWQAIPVNVDAGREGGDLCRAAADFAKRRDLFAMPAPTNGEPCSDTTSKSTPRTITTTTSAITCTTPATTNPAPRNTSKSCSLPTNQGSITGSHRETPNQIAAPAAPNAVGQPVAEPEPVAPARSAAHGSATNDENGEPCSDTTSSTSEPAISTVPPSRTTTSPSTIPAPTTTVSELTTTSSPTSPTSELTTTSSPTSPISSTSTANEWTDTSNELPRYGSDRDRLRVRIIDLIAQGHEQTIRRNWPDGVPTLKHEGHTDDELAQILAAVRRVETEVGAAWHPDDGPPPHVNTNPRAEVEYPAARVEGGLVPPTSLERLDHKYSLLGSAGIELCGQVAAEAHAAGRSISVSANPTVRRWSIARAVIAWAASGRSVDDLWFTVSLLATFEQTRDPAATLGGLISQFTIEQAERLYEAAAT